MATATARQRKAVAEKIAEQIAPSPLGTLIDEMFDLREKKRLLEAQVAEIESAYNTKAELLMERLDAEKTDKAAGRKASASITTGVVANVEDWAKVEAYVKKTGHFQLFQRRISDAAYRELAELAGKKGIPGITPFTKKRINLRVI